MKRRSDEEISAPLYAFDAEVRSQYGCFAGVDEAGRGPLCGPVCVAACILDPENPVYGINDSKKLTEKKREALYDEISKKALRCTSTVPAGRVFVDGYGVGDVGIYAFCTAAPECKRFEFRNITTDDVEMDFFD